jgi:predicted HTH domain antitoxin
VTQKSVVVTVRLSRRDLERIEAVRTLETVERSALLKEFIEDRLSRRVVGFYQDGKLTSGRAAEILGVTLREFLEVLEKAGVPVNWDSDGARSFSKIQYRE